MSGTYWSSLTSSRLSRRRALVASGALAGGAAFLAACGGSKWLFTSENATLDIHFAGAPLNTPRCMCYSDLIMSKPGYMGQPEYKDYLPDLAQSWEVSPDKLMITFKLNPGVKWHNKAPVNGRTVDADDLRVTWERFVKQGRIRTSIANAASPTAPVLSWTVPDATTVVMKVKEPTTDLFATMTGPYAGLPSIIPKETDSPFDMR